jgi:hypothetical protein
LPAGLAGLFLMGLLASGCAGFFGVSRNTERSSSIVGYLYPDQKDPLPPTSIPVLRLPLRVGIAFVPPVASGGYYGEPRISEMQKNALMQRVADEFKGRITSNPSSSSRRPTCAPRAALKTSIRSGSS